MRQESSYLKGLRNGDIEDFRCLFDQYHQKVYAYCFKFVRNHQVAEELTSDAFMKLWNKRDQIEWEDPINKLLFKITKCLAIDFLRKMSRTAQSKEQYLKYCETHPPLEEENDAFIENLSAIKKALEGLPPKRRKVFELRYEEEMSYLQIAHALDVSPNTVKVHLNKATKYLRQQLQIHYAGIFLLAIFYYSDLLAF